MSKITEVYDDLSYGPALEDSAPAHAWLDSYGRRFGCFVAGEWVMAGHGFASVDPAKDTDLAWISHADDVLVDRAVQSARAALDSWQATPGSERARLLYAVARAIQRRARLFAVLETLDTGKPIRESRDLDVPLAVRHFIYHAGWAALAEREFPGHQPVGVCGQVIPWNFPLLMLAWKVAPALAMGNTVVVKPAETTPLTALLFAEICQSVGVPAGVVNIVTGDGATGKALVRHERLDKIAFTGSTEVGREIRRATAARDVKLSLELGGKSPFMVFADADLDAAVEGIVDSIWLNQGQVCCAGSRLLVQEAVEAKLLAKLQARMQNLRIGDPLDKAVDMGALNSRIQLSRVSGLVDEAVEHGATLIQPTTPLPECGCFYPPTVLAKVEPASQAAQVEIFGPVLVTMSFRTPDEAVALANNSRYGLAASVWTQNVDVAHDMAARVHAGTVWVNCANQFDAAAEFGGVKESGFGREGGREGLLEYLAPVKAAATEFSMAPVQAAPIDRTHKLFVGGKQVRPDGGNSYRADGHEFAHANRKDVRNAVEAAAAAQPGWAASTGYLRSQILFYLAENLAAEKAVLTQAGCGDEEFEASLNLIFRFAAWADKWDGETHGGPSNTLLYTRREPHGVVGAVCPDRPAMVGLLGAVLPLVATGNTVVALVSESHPLMAAELYRVMDASDIPAGVINLLTGPRADTLPHLTGHLGVDAVWHFAAEGAEVVRRESAGNLKPVWVESNTDWADLDDREWLRRATRVKAVWVPYGA